MNSQGARRECQISLKCYQGRLFTSIIKGNFMTTSKQVLGLLALAVSLGVTMSTHAAPPDRSQLNRTHNNFLSASTCVGYTCEYIETYQTEDSLGTLTGWIQVQLLDYTIGFLLTIYCSGPEYANVVSLNMANGTSRLNAFLDPSVPNCSSTNVGSPVTLSLVGQADGIYRNISRGTSVLEFAGVKYVQEYVVALYSEIFYGNGAFLAGPLTGQVGENKVTDRQRVK